jgi:hypothetical protein
LKLALIGANQLTLEYAKKLKSLEVELHIFYFEKYPSYSSPIVDISQFNALLVEGDKIYKNEVIQLSKSTLMPNEELVNQSRFKDLFRLYYLVDPSAFINKQRLEQPEIYQKLTDEFSSSLETSLEMFIDVDLVVNTSFQRAHSFLGNGHYTLGERKLDRMLSYPENYSDKIFSHTDEFKELAIVGSGKKAEFVIEHLHAWLKNKSTRLFIVSIDEDPFDKCQNTAVLNILKEIENEWELDFKKYEFDLKAWNEYDDFVKVKITKPEEPIPRIVYFSGHNVMAVDRLVDKNRYFLTLEKSELRQSIKHADNALLQIKTIACDQVIVATQSSKQDHLVSSLNFLEKGYLYSPYLIEGESKEDIDLKKQSLENWLFTLFSKKDVQ